MDFYTSYTQSRTHHYIYWGRKRGKRVLPPFVEDLPYSLLFWEDLKLNADSLHRVLSLME